MLQLSVAPYKVAIALLSEEENAVKFANALHDELNKKGIDTILDDRDERAGVKFNDLELIGIPIRITIGKKLSEGFVQIFNFRL